VVPLFSQDRVIVAGRPQRIPLALVAPTIGEDVALPPDDGEIVITVDFEGETVDEVAVVGHIVDHDHVGEDDPDHQHANLFRYYPLRTTLPQPGIYDLTINSEGTTVELPIQAFDPGEVNLPLPGEPFPSVVTPTLTSNADVDRICTRFEPCPFHDESADAILAQGRPLALLVATPAYCATAYCGPVLDTLLEAWTTVETGPKGPSDIGVVHVEVYANPDEVDGDFLDPAIRLAPAVLDLRLEFEPSLFLVDRSGVLVDRIDNVFDLEEAAVALLRLRQG
jgi:hypothetical protein